MTGTAHPPTVHIGHVLRALRGSPYETASDPLCCDEPMVHNSLTSQFECAAAYFTLANEGFGEDVLVNTTAGDVGPELEPTLAHWRASRIPDGSTSP